MSVVNIQREKCMRSALLRVIAARISAAYHGDMTPVRARQCRRRWRQQNNGMAKTKARRRRKSHREAKENRNDMASIGIISAAMTQQAALWRSGRRMKNQQQKVSIMKEIISVSESKQQPHLAPMAKWRKMAKPANNVSSSVTSISNRNK